jgi:hypothetical protein
MEIENRFMPRAINMQLVGCWAADFKKIDLMTTI